MTNVSRLVSALFDAKVEVERAYQEIPFGQSDLLAKLRDIEDALDEVYRWALDQERVL